MSQNIYVTQPTLAPLNEVTEIMQKIWDSGIMTHNGPLVQQFEKEAQAFLGCSNLVACTNGTIALQMAIRALGLKGEIITTPFTFIATISSIMWEHCTPVFVDIDPETLNIDPEKIEEKITCHTVAIMPVHVFGNACEIDKINEIAKAHNLKVIYDAAHAVGVKYKGKCILDYGEKLRRIRFFGFENHVDIVEDGFNGKMTEVHAALGLANLKYLQNALDDRKKKYNIYKTELSRKASLSFQKITHDCNYSYFPLIFDTEKNLLAAVASLNAEGIFPRRYFYPSVNTFNKLVPYVKMPISENIASRILCLPLYYTLSEPEMERITKIIVQQ